ncbi:hypothetical protein KCU81_g7500, partial [Aureobasidium melanogenum]
MDPDPHSKLSATNAIATLRSNFRTSTQALKTLEQYLRHLENLLLEELGREEFERRLECLILRDQRDGESLFIPEDTLISRKRRGSSSTEMGSEMKKKVRVDSAVSDLGRSIFDGGGRLHSDSPDLSPKSARNTPVPWELPAVDAQQTRTTTTAVKQTARHPIVAPRSRPPRGSQSVMLPNKQPSSNFHSGSQSTLLLNLHPSPDFNSGSIFPSIIKKRFCTVRQSSIEAITLWLSILYPQQSSARTEVFQLCKTFHRTCITEETSRSFGTRFKFFDQAATVSQKQVVIILIF